MQDFEVVKDTVTISTKKQLLDLNLVHSYISNSYWAQAIPRQTVLKSIQNSLCFGIYKDKQQIGLARVVSDYSTFAYLAEIFIINSEKGKGYSKLLIETLLTHPELQGLRRFCLGTKDAHTLYSRYGFAPLPNPKNWLEIKNDNIYLEEQNQT